MTESKKPEKSSHDLAPSTFAATQKAMVATNDGIYGKRSGLNLSWYERQRDYTEEQVREIISSGSLDQKKQLSRHFFNKDGYYKQLILYYSTLLKYMGILIPNPTAGNQLSKPHVSKKYFQAMEYIDRIPLQTYFVDWGQKILVDGCYYGIITSIDKKDCAIIDLPADYCQTRFKDCYGNDIVEFNLGYFDSIQDENTKRSALAAYPDFISKAYAKKRKGKLATNWIIIPTEYSVCFPAFGGSPFFLNVIPATLEYDKAVDTEQEKAKKEIEKIIVQQIPHLSDGRLLFEPDEVLEMHNGAVGMVKNNSNTTVLTTYANVDAITSKGSADTTNNSLDRMKQNIYGQAGVSGEIFAATGGNTTETSIKYDMAIMMYLANKFAKLITDIVNRIFSNSNINFKYTILPITYQNESKYIDSAYKLGTAGYSLIVPALAQGFSQKDLINLKVLENDVLDLTNKLLPPKTSYTQSSESQEGAGRPTLDNEDKTDKTIQNKDSIGISKTQGGSD